MSRRIEVELTSTRDDGTWTWRAAGAKLPKGELDGSLLYSGAKVGDVVRADADFMMDGIVIMTVLAPKGARKEAERIEVVGTPRRDDEPLVTSKLAPKGRRDGDRRPRRDGDERRGDGPDRKPRKPRAEGDRASGPRPDSRPRTDRPDRPARPTRPAPEPKPKAKRLRAGRIHRNAVLASLPPEQKPIAEQVLRGGIPAVRLAVEKQNETNKEEGKPEISPAPLLALAEQLMPALRTAEWRDKAEAAIADIADLDLRDLRSVVVASDLAARDEETRALAEQLRVGLAQRVESEHIAWLAEIAETLESGRSVRALRVSSRPPKAGSPLPPELATRLADAASASLTPETGSDRYATVLDALAFSPVRTQVTPSGIPAEPTPELLAAVKKVAGRLPAIAALFGIEAAPASKSGRPKSKPRPPKPAMPVKAVPDTADTADAVVGDAAVIEVVEETVIESPDGAVVGMIEEVIVEAVVETPDGEVVEIVDVTDTILVDFTDGTVVEVLDTVEEAIVEIVVETPAGEMVEVVDTITETVVESADGEVVEVVEVIETVTEIAVEVED
jgi:hypothetical protein